MDFFQAGHWIGRKAAALRQTSENEWETKAKERSLVLLTPSSCWDLKGHPLITPRLITALGLAD